MGYAGKLAEKQLAIELRNRGFSYNQIRQKVPVSKDTLSRWCRHITLLPGYQLKLDHRRLNGANKGRLIGAKKQQLKRIKETESIKVKAIGEVGNLNKRERFLVGVGLYIGDGLKGDKAIGFSNSHPPTVAFMMAWFREFCDLSESDFHASIWLHNNLDENKARKFWSRITKIPPKQFYKTYLAKDKSASKKMRKNIHENGVLGIRINKASRQRKILGWAEGVLRNT
jgi:hypothetical protein